MKSKTATLPALVAAALFGTGTMFLAGCPEDFETEPMEPAPQQEPAEQPAEPAPPPEPEPTEEPADLNDQADEWDDQLDNETTY